MEANIRMLKISFRKNKLWSNLEEKSQNEQFKTNPGGLPKADDGA